MSRKFSGHAVTRAKNLYQAYVLLLLGIIFLLLAWLLHPSTSEYPIGVMMLGIGMAIAALLNPYRLVIASWLTTLLGIAVFLCIALMGRRGYIKAGAITPGIIVLLVGIIEALLLAGRTPNNFVPFMLSLWLPGIGLCVLGLLYMVASIRD